jgi:hypothetical protein
MSKRVKEKIGEELYNKVIEAGLKESDFDLLEGYLPRQRFNEVSEKLKVNEEKVKSYEKQLEDTKKLLETNEEYKNKYSELEVKFNTEIANKDLEISNVLKKALVKESLINAGAKHPDLLMPKIDFSKLAVENEALKGFDDTLNGFKETYKDLFVEKVNKQETPTGGTGEGNKPTGSAGSDIPGLEDFDFSIMDKY